MEKCSFIRSLNIVVYALVIIEIITVCFIGVEIFNDQKALRNCDKYSVEMTVTGKEVTGSIRYRKCNLYIGDEEAEYRIAMVSPDIFNSYEKGDSIECIVYKNDEGKILKVKLFEDL